MIVLVWKSYHYLLAKQTGRIHWNRSYIADDDDDDDDDDDVKEKEYPPCIRAIVMQSDKMPVGSLNIITCMGLTFGRYVQSFNLVYCKMSKYEFCCPNFALRENNRA